MVVVVVFTVWTSGENYGYMAMMVTAAIVMVMVVATLLVVLL